MNNRKPQFEFKRPISTNAGNVMSSSGNSEVNVKVETDTSSLACAMLCLAHATGQISDDELVRTITNFNRLIGKEKASLPLLLSNNKTLEKNNKTQIFRKFG